MKAAPIRTARKPVAPAPFVSDPYGHRAALTARGEAYARYNAALASADPDLERVAREEITRAQLAVARAEHAALAESDPELRAARAASDASARRAHKANEQSSKPGRGVVPGYLIERLDAAVDRAARARSAAMEARNHLARLMNEDALRLDRRAWLERQFPELRSEAA